MGFSRDWFPPELSLGPFRAFALAISDKHRALPYVGSGALSARIASWPTALHPVDVHAGRKRRR